MRTHHYQKMSSLWNKNINELIRLRNKDAHGEVISDEALAGELNNRQKLLDQLMKEMNYHADYTLIVPIDDEVKDGVLVHICRDLSGNAENIIQLKDFYTKEKFRLKNHLKKL